MFAVVTITARALAAALAAGCLLAPTLAFAEDGAPSYAQPFYGQPSYASPEETIHGRITDISGPYTITVEDDRGFLDNVHLHHGTIINPTGLTLAAGMSVTIHGYNGGTVLEANEIDCPYSYDGPLPEPVYYGPGWWYPGFEYGYGPSFCLSFVFGGPVFFERREFFRHPWGLGWAPFWRDRDRDWDDHGRLAFVPRVDTAPGGDRGNRFVRVTPPVDTAPGGDRFRRVERVRPSPVSAWDRFDRGRGFTRPSPVSAPVERGFTRRTFSTPRSTAPYSGGYRSGSYGGGYRSAPYSGGYRSGSYGGGYRSGSFRSSGGGSGSRSSSGSHSSGRR